MPLCGKALTQSYEVLLSFAYQHNVQHLHMGAQLTVMHACRVSTVANALCLCVVQGDWISMQAGILMTQAQKVHDLRIMAAASAHVQRCWQSVCRMSQHLLRKQTEGN